MFIIEKLHNQFSNEQIIKPSCHLSQKELNYEQGIKFIGNYEIKLTLLKYL